MAQFTNNPSLRNQQGEGTIKRYVHQAITIDHNGIKAAIQTNGKIIITGRPTRNGDEMEYDEVEIPASLVFKLGSLLRATREVKYVAISEVANTAPVESED